MGTLQEDLNQVGQSMRDVHKLADLNGNAALKAAAAKLHTQLAEGFVRHIRPEHPELDWNAIAGNPAATKLPTGAQTQSGGKHEPDVS